MLLQEIESENIIQANISSIKNSEIVFEVADLKQESRAIIKIGNWEKVAISEITPGSAINQTQIGIALAVAGIIIIVFVFCIVCYFRRKSHKKDEEMKQQINEMSAREVDNRKTAKNVFEEYMLWDTQPNLETPSGMIGSGLPFRDYRSFVLHVMFPPGDPSNEDFHIQLLVPNYDI